MTVKEAREEYNELLDRYYKANEYFEDESKTESEKEKQIKNYSIILLRLSGLLTKVGPYKKEEILGGMNS